MGSNIKGPDTKQLIDPLGLCGEGYSGEGTERGAGGMGRGVGDAAGQVAVQTDMQLVEIDGIGVATAFDNDFFDSRQQCSGTRRCSSVVSASFSRRMPRSWPARLLDRAARRGAFRDAPQGARMTGDGRGCIE